MNIKNFLIPHQKPISTFCEADVTSAICDAMITNLQRTFSDFSGIDFKCKLRTQETGSYHEDHRKSRTGSEQQLKIGEDLVGQISFPAAVFTELLNKASGNSQHEILRPQQGRLSHIELQFMALVGQCVANALAMAIPRAIAAFNPRSFGVYPTVEFSGSTQTPRSVQASSDKNIVVAVSLTGVQSKGTMTLRLPPLGDLLKSGQVERYSKVREDRQIQIDLTKNNRNLNLEKSVRQLLRSLNATSLVEIASGEPACIVAALLKMTSLSVRKSILTEMDLDRAKEVIACLASIRPSGSIFLVVLRKVLSAKLKDDCRKSRIIQLSELLLGGRNAA